MSGNTFHLLVLIHGMWGNPGHLAEAHRIFDELRVQPAKQDPNGVQLRVLTAETNREESTYDGIDWGAERVANEVYDEITKIEQEGGKVTRFSVMGYSLGGLVARYLIGIMHQRGTFETITPVNFNTFATPHIGLLRLPNVWSRLANTLGPYLLSRTGEQFFAVDKWSERGRPLIEVMADPDRIFYQALTLFPHIRVYANAINDVTVPYTTAAFETEDPFLNYKTTGIEIEYMEGYKPLMQSWKIPDHPPTPEPKPTMFSITWFKSYTPPLPPVLQWKFPFNIALIALLPILFPAFISLAVTRLSLASRSSRSRIKLLEKGDSPRLLSIVAELEREIEEFVVDAAEANNVPSTAPASAPLTPTEKLSDTTLLSDSSASSSSPAVAPFVPQFSTPQKRALAWLNALPRLKKERVWIPDVRNSHATVIARDVVNFPFHKLGHGALRHWADHFIL